MANRRSETAWEVRISYVEDESRFTLLCEGLPRLITVALLRQGAEPPPSNPPNYLIAADGFPLEGAEREARHPKT